MTKKTLSVLCAFLCALQLFSQQKNKLFLAAGYGIAGSFFVRSHEESDPVPAAKVFYKKNFVGVSQNAGIGIYFGKTWEARLGINYQHFTRSVES
jgi:hypothetical protein